MRDTKIVFIGIAVLILFPLLFHGLRCVIKIRKQKDKKNLYYSLASHRDSMYGITASVFGTYKFTISYQAPWWWIIHLVEERLCLFREMGTDHGAYLLYLSENIS